MAISTAQAIAIARARSAARVDPEKYGAGVTVPRDVLDRLVRAAASEPSAPRGPAEELLRKYGRRLVAFDKIPMSDARWKLLLLEREKLNEAARKLVAGSPKQEPVNG